jgi:hypothetical protein
LCGAYFFYEVLLLTLLEVCSEQRKPNNYGLIRPAGAAKKADPITAPKVIANREVGSFGLAKLSFSLATETIAENKKYNQGENRKKDHNYSNLDSGEQHGTQRQDLPKQGDDQKNEGGDACNCFEN